MTLRSVYKDSIDTLTIMARSYMHPAAAEFRRCADAPVDEAIPQLNLPYIMKALRIELGTDTGTIRFHGYFNDPNRVEHRVRIVKKAVGPSTDTCGRESDRLKVARILAAASASAPFEPIGEVAEATADEVDCRKREEAERAAHLADLRVRAAAGEEIDDMEYYDVCFFPTNVIDLRFELITNGS
jgi:hypothetical protein